MSGVRFLGNVDLGQDVSLDVLHRHYDTLIAASGAAVDRRLGIERKEAAARWRGRLGDRGVWEDRHTQCRHLDPAAVLGTTTSRSMSGTASCIRMCAGSTCAPGR
jgi:hypothetical protein